MAETIEIPIELAHFQLPEAVQERLQFLLDCQDAGEVLTQAERREAEGLVELVEFYLCFTCVRNVLHSKDK